MPIDAPRVPCFYRTGVTDQKTPGTGDPDFGLRLKRAREAAGLTQAQLGAKIGREQNTISDYETGSVMPEAKDVGRLARAVGARVEYLLEGLSTGMPHEVERFLLSFPKSAWRKIGKLSPQERELKAREFTALLGVKPATAERPKRQPRK